MSYQSYNTSSAYDLRNEALGKEEVATHLKRPLKKVDKRAVTIRNIKRYAMIATVVVLAFMMVRGYVAIDELDGKITNLKKENSSINAENQAIQAEIDKNLDPGELQKVAEECGMAMPESYQKIYYDIESDDSGTVIDGDEKEKTSFEGASGMLVDSMNIFD
ncbi:MAG: hypothetical protein E7415_04795 [Ruminococcaceae bacterium]|nr:hypothetical protein [Oscillospiraceae bacterium]